MLSSVAIKYARALIEVASERRMENQVIREVKEFQHLLKSHEELLEAYLNPALPFSAKRAITEQLAERLSLSVMVSNFLLVVLENGRMRHFDLFVEAVQSVDDERRGVVRGEVASASKLDPSVRDRVLGAVKSLSGKDVRLSFHEDEELIGGLKLTIGSEIYDGSVRTQLDSIRKMLEGEL